MNSLIDFVIGQSEQSLKCLRESLRILVVLFSDFEVSANKKIVEFVRKIGIIITKQHIQGIFS